MVAFKLMLRKLKTMHKAFSLLAGLTVVAILSVTFLDVATKAISIRDGEDTKTIYTLSDDADDILAQAGVSLDEKDEYTFSGIEDGEGKINVLRAFNVTVKKQDRVYTLETASGTVKDALKLSGIKIDEDDFVSYELDKKLEADMNIVVNDVTYSTETKQVSIGYTTKTVYSDKLTKGKSTLTNGKNGTKQITYRYKLVDGKVVDTQVIDQKIISEPVNAVKTVGTKVEAKTSYLANTSKYVSSLKPSNDIALDENGVPVNYSKKIVGLASAYTWTGNKTYTGKTPQTGYIAVNTNIIPLHTRMFIRTPDGAYYYGYAIAEDTGGFAKTTSRIVDMYFNTRSECYRFGVRNVEIYILD